MFSVLPYVLCSALLGSTLAEDSDLKFPDHFLFGAASSSYQVEGAWNVADKGISIWDEVTHNKSYIIKDGTTGDVACDSYHKYKTDVQMIKALGLNFYRFSISWPRLLPTGYPTEISEDGKRYYNALINELLDNNITPVVTMYHWDLPQSLQDLGGWTNPLIADWFEDYARVLYKLFGDRVKVWITINEPIAICDIAYQTGNCAPSLVYPDLGNYLCNKHVLLAHARAYRLYDKYFREKQKGEVSITNVLFWYEPATPEDKELTDLVIEYGTGRYSHPIYSKEGGWPKKVEKYIHKKSLQQGYKRSRLPELTPEEIKFIRGTYDFYAMNYYTGRLIRSPKPGEVVGAFPMFGVQELDAIMETDPKWKPGQADWFFEFPEGFRRQLKWLKDNYGDIKIWITENGYAGKPEDGLMDRNRCSYYRDHLKALLAAIKIDKVNVVGYTAWTLMDNYEWFDGYTTRFGLYHVDFKDKDLKRTPRLSAKYYKQIVATKTIQPLPSEREEL